MHTIWSANVNDAYRLGLVLLRENYMRASSRVGDVLVAPWPVVTVYAYPCQRVLFDAQRDANPFFHLFEALWMLAGRRDAVWLDQFVKDFSARFAEEGGIQHGAYGHRWRDFFDLDGGGHPTLPDQLDLVVQLLRKNPDDRRAVITMWDPVADLGADKRDIPCNTHIYLRVRQRTEAERTRRLRSMGVREDPAERNLDGSDYHLMNMVDDERVLDLTVCCRSNDIIWGAYGANAVHFSVLQEYLAARIGVQVGRLYQISNNFHAYVDTLAKVGEPSDPSPVKYDGVNVLTTTIVADPQTFDIDLETFMRWTAACGGQPHQDTRGLIPTDPQLLTNRFFTEVAVPMFKAAKLCRSGQLTEAFAELTHIPLNLDWGVAARMWVERRLARRGNKL